MVPLERATRISPKRRLRRMQRGEIEEAAGELPAKAGKATIAATVSADGARKKAPSFDGAFGAGDEDFAEAPPAADTARRNRGSGGRIARESGQGDHCRDGERRWSAQKSTIFRWCLWSGRRGSNSLPPPWQGGALPDELRPRNDAYYSRPFLICQVKKRFLANKSPKCTQPFSVRAV